MALHVCCLPVASAHFLQNSRSKKLTFLCIASSNVSAKKTTKRVVIQSPPQSPEELPRRLSSGRVSPPPPPPPEHHEDDDDSGSTATADSDLEQASRNTRRNSGSLQSLPVPGASASGAPLNPFAKTLATSEAAFGLQQVNDGSEETGCADGEGMQKKGNGPRPAMDVDQFKNILMTGSAVPSPPVPGPTQRFEDNSSSTNASSRSQHSLFDPNFEINQDTPRTSLDMMCYSSTSDDDEEGSSLMSSSERLDDFAPPAPPKNSQRKPPGRGPQTVSFQDFDSMHVSVPPVSTSQSTNLKPATLHRSPSDLNKPLPSPPQDPAMAERTISSEQAPKEPSAESSSQTKKAPPPPPPASRRAGQSTQGLGRSPSSDKVPTITEDTSVIKSAETASRSGSAPPPPPARKARPLSQSAAPSSDPPSDAPSPAPNIGETKSAPMPPPPPRRNPSKVGPGTSVNRTPSTASHSSARKENQTPSNQNAPAPPPPRRGGNAKRDSVDGGSSSMAHALSGRISSDMERRGSEMSISSGKWNPSQPVAEAEELPGTEQPTSTSSTDILADMNAFQAEIDALRARAGRG